MNDHESKIINKIYRYLGYPFLCYRNYNSAAITNISIIIHKEMSYYNSYLKKYETDKYDNKLHAAELQVWR